MSELIKLVQVQAVAEELVAANPDLMNPRDEKGRCLYAKLPGFDDTIDIANRCLGGEILVKLGLRLPEEHTTAYNSPDADRFTKAAMAYLVELQRLADHMMPTGQGRTWGEALELSKTPNHSQWYAEYYDE